MSSWTCCELEKTIKQETAISYRLLRYLNSPLFGFSLEIKSIRHAMAILGERELRCWIRLVVAGSAAEQKCSELVLTGLARARFLRVACGTSQSGKRSIPDGLFVGHGRHPRSYGASINSIFPSRVRCRIITLPLGSRKTKTSRSRKWASLIASSRVIGRKATESLACTR